MNDLIKVNTMSENLALNKCQQILNDRREALASKAKKNTHRKHDVRECS